MENTVRSTPKDVFLHLFNIFTFYLSIIGFITLYINYVNALFPDALNYFFSSIANGVRWSSSVLFVSVPSYILTSWLLAKDIKVEPERRDLKLRKWLVYFTLFLAAVTIIVDLMILVYNFLDGELSVRFFLKVFVVLVVASSVFGYYLWDLKRTNIKSKVPKILAMVVGGIVLASIVLGFFVVGTPAEQRRRRMDDQRINELQMIQSQIIEYWTRKEVLPQKLTDLQDNISGFVVPTDPETKQQYEYVIQEPLKFELCAVFSTSNKELAVKNQSRYYAYDMYQQNWEHEEGRACFSRTIDPELYKNQNSVKPLPVR